VKNGPLRPICSRRSPSPTGCEKVIEAGFLNYITKPVMVNQFMDTLDAALAFVQTAWRGAVPRKTNKWNAKLAGPQTSTIAAAAGTEAFDCDSQRLARLGIPGPGRVSMVQAGVCGAHRPVRAALE